MKIKILITAVLLVFLIQLNAQYRIGLIPRVSPTQKVTNTIGYTEVSVKYSSPAVKDRQIWGDLVAYDKVWRAGANEATKLTFTNDVIIDNQEIKAGDYALFIIPREHNTWSIILSENSEQWGAFTYKKEEEIFRKEIIPRFNVNYAENLKYEIQDIGFDFGIIRILWENIEVELEFRTKILENLENKIQEEINKLELSEHWVVYLQGAEFLTGRKQNLQQAQEWLEKSELLFNTYGEKYLNNKPYFLGHIYWTKGMCFLAMEKTTEAKEYFNKCKKIDKGKGYYTKGIGKEKAELVLAQI